MKKLVISLLFLLLLSFVALNANVKGDIGRWKRSEYSISFVKIFNRNLEKDGSVLDYAKLSQTMLYLGIGGVVLAATSLSLIVTGGVLYYLAILTDIFGADWLTITWASYALIGLFSFFLVVGIGMAIACLILWYVFGKKVKSTSLFMESNVANIVSLINSNIGIPNISIGLKYSF